MDTAEITALSVVIFIAAMELICLFVCSRLRRKSYPLCTVLPVFPDDEELPQRLDYIGSLIEDGSCCVENVILLDMGGNSSQSELCREFCGRFNAAEYISPEEIKTAMRRYLRSQHSS